MKAVTRFISTIVPAMIECGQKKLTLCTESETESIGSGSIVPVIINHTRAGAHRDSGEDLKTHRLSERRRRCKGLQHDSKTVF
jgi:hypothetical protein